MLGSGLMPTFGVIKDLITFQDCHFLVCKILDTECFLPHLHAYEVHYQVPSVICFCKINELYDYHPLGLYHSPMDNNILVIPLKYHIMEVI